MMKSKNIILYEIIAVLSVFTIVYFVAVNKASYAFAYDDKQTLYDNRMKLIDKSAKLYGENNMSLFEDEKTIYVTVSDLVEKSYLLPDDENGNVKDPTSDVKLLNDLRVRITLEDGKIETKILLN
ncbi:MAG: hypothetical protein E7167_03580 [Firmicutes bacterium]|nr:hypothetical protein [Bacillota bacterium]